MISFDKKFIFIHIPKTAGTSLEVALEDDSCIFKRGEWAKKPMGFNAPLNHLTISQIQHSRELSIDDFNSFFKFTFVRNPWDKVISECFCGQIQLVFKDCKTIKEKIKKVCALSKTQFGYAAHCKPQTDFITHPNFEMNFIGRFESLKKDYNTVCEKLSLKNRELSHKNKSDKKPYQEYFDQETIDLVAESYRKDIDYFGYKFD
jgi:chondroitin 4-sulfotransferase 11